jgi:hypothetical protein
MHQLTPESATTVVGSGARECRSDIERREPAPDDVVRTVNENARTLKFDRPLKSTPGSYGAFGEKVPARRRRLEAWARP